MTDSPYKLNGETVPRVSEIVRSWQPPAEVERLMKWAAWESCNQGDPAGWERKFEDAGHVGTLVHRLIETLGDKNASTPAAEAGILGPAMSACANWIHWATSIGDFQILEKEVSLVSQAGFGGTLDAIMRINGSGFWIVDWKTGSKIKTSDVLQQAAYRVLAEEHGHKISGAMIVRLGKKPGVEDWQELRLPNDVLDRYQEVFVRLLECHTILGEVKKPRSRTHKSAGRSQKNV